jgi:hypothetical protein
MFSLPFNPAEQWTFIGWRDCEEVPYGLRNLYLTVCGRFRDGLCVWAGFGFD